MRLRPEKAELFARFLQACCRPGAVLEVYEGKTYLVAWVAGREEDWKLWIYRDGRGWKEARLLHINFLGGRTWWNIPPEPGEAEPPPGSTWKGRPPSGKGRPSARRAPRRGEASWKPSGPP